MLKKLDKYIIRKYLSSFFFVVLICSLIAISIDFSEKIDDFIEDSAPIKEIIFNYYMNFVIWINGLLWPLFTLIAVIFFTSRLANNSEVLSILNAGVSFRRLCRPYLIAASLITGILLISNHFIIPYGNKVRLDFEHTYIWKHSDKGKANDVHFFIGPDTKVYIKFWKKKSATAQTFHLEKIVDNKLTYLMKANKAEWKGPPNNWRLHDYQIRTFDENNETFVNGKGMEMDTTLNLKPEDFVRYLNHKEMMDTPELSKFIVEERGRGSGNTKNYEVELHRRTADPFSIIILTLIGLSIAGRKVRGGIGLHILIGLIIGGLYIFLSRFSSIFAENNRIPTLLGVWVPNIIFGIVAIIMMFRAQK